MQFSTESLKLQFAPYLPEYEIDVCCNGQFWQARVVHPPEGKHLSSVGLTKEEVLDNLKEKAIRELEQVA